MYRLLQYKGYRFPGLSEHSTAGLVSPGDVLKTEDELEQEDRVAQGAVRIILLLCNKSFTNSAFYLNSIEITRTASSWNSGCIGRSK